ncbi:MAG: hypothetical protein ABIE23_02115 [archaeon]|nr:hypothetical protein [Candidatus Micrarchaeota archaeon]
MKSYFEEKYLDLKRKGDAEKINWMENIDKHIRESMIDRIISNDKSVLNEVVIPKWVSWDLLLSWAQEKRKKEKPDLCVLCGKRDEIGVYFNNKYICERCFIELKNLG